MRYEIGMILFTPFIFMSLLKFQGLLFFILSIGFPVFLNITHVRKHFRLLFPAASRNKITEGLALLLKLMGQFGEKSLTKQKALNMCKHILLRRHFQDQGFCKGETYCFYKTGFSLTFYIFFFFFFYCCLLIICLPVIVFSHSHVY